MSLTKVDTSMIVGNLPATRIDGAPVNVINYGATGDGVTDDTAAIQAAIDAAEGKLLLIPAGTYMINDTGLTVTGRCVIQGSGETTVLKKTTNTSGNYAIITFPTGAGGSAMSNVTFDGDWETHTATTGEYGHCVVISGSDVTVRDCVMQSAWGDGIYINGADSVTVDNCKVQYNRRNNISVIRGQNHTIVNSLLLKGGRRQSDNAIGTSPRAGIDLEPNSGDSLVNTTISNCEFQRNDAAGINVTGVYTHRNTMVSNSVFTENAYGFEISNNCIGLTIQGCIFTNRGTSSTLGGILLSASASEMVVVTGCIFDGLGYKGIYGAAAGLNVSGCKFIGSTDNGIQLDTYGTNDQVVITGNYFEGQTTAIDLTGQKNGEISGNVFRSVTSRAIQLRDTFELFVTGNKFKECANDGVAVELIHLDNNTASRLNVITNNFLFNESGVYPTYVVKQRFGSTGAQNYVANNVFPNSVTQSLNCVALGYTWGTAIPDTY